MWALLSLLVLFMVAACFLAFWTGSEQQRNETTEVRAVGEKQSGRAAPRWKCPHCNTSIELTWKRYAAAPLPRHRCPECRVVSKLNSGPYWIWLARTGGILLGGVPLGIVASPGGFGAGLGGFVVGALLIGIPIDKYLDARYRNLVPLQK